MTIAQVIAGRGEVWSCHADDSVADAVDMLARYRIGALPVEDGTNGVAGIFSERDVIYCLERAGAEALDWPVSAAMTAPAITVGPGESILGALALMTRRRIRHLPVVEGGRCIGFISIGDLVKHRIERIENR